MIRHYENKHKPKRTSPTAGKLNESKQKGSEKQSSEKQPEINFTAGNRKDFIFLQKKHENSPCRSRAKLRVVHWKTSRRASNFGGGEKCATFFLCDVRRDAPPLLGYRLGDSDLGAWKRSKEMQMSERHSIEIHFSC